MNISAKALTIGQIFSTNDGGSVTVINIINSRNVEVRHNDQHGHVNLVRLEHLNNGTIKNPYFPSVYNIGYLGVGPYQAYVNRIPTKAYTIWSSMINRCYVTRTQLKYPWYLGCSVHVDWHNFQNFVHWYCNHPFYRTDYELDKDITNEYNKIYSPTYCTLVPKVVNNLFRDFSKTLSDNGLPTGVYLNGKRYECIACGIYLGKFDTPEQASQVYLNYKRNYILQIAEQYKYLIEIHVYYSLVALAHTA